jgi:hypothetical protein
MRLHSGSRETVLNRSETILKPTHSKVKQRTPQQAAGYSLKVKSMFEREDWELFRNLEGLCSRAGVSRDKIASLVAKELTDNALDAGIKCYGGLLPYFITTKF